MTISIALGLSPVSFPVISGAPNVGSILRIAPVQMAGAGPLTYSFQWLRDGTAIPSATSAEYTVVAADEGSAISLRLTLPDNSVQTSANSFAISASEPPPSANETVTVAAAVRDTIIYDTGAARGENAASIPLSGTTTAPDGANIRAEIVDAVTGVVVHASAKIAEASGGAWSGAYEGVERTSSWLKARVWVAGNAAEAAETTDRFGAGHVIVLWGQSEIQNITVDFYDGANPADTVTADEMVSFHWHDRNPDATGSAGITHHLMTVSDGYNTRLPAMANALIAARPGEKFAVILQTDSGTGFADLVTENPNGRVWSDDETLHNEATGGGDVGAAGWSWYAAPRTYGNQYASIWHQMTFGVEIDGTPVAAGETYPYDIGGRFEAEHLISELYDYTKTKMVMLEPHRFETGGSTIFPLRDSVRGMMTASSYAADGTILYGHPVLSYRNANVGDSAHPQAGQGSIDFGVGLVNSVIRAMGLTDWAYPVIDNCYWEPAGAYVELWSSAGDITTRDTSRVTGVVIDGAYVDGTIVNGRIRVNSADVGSGDAFLSSTALDFVPLSTGLEGEAEGAFETEWVHYPLVDLSVPGMVGVPLATSPDAAVLASSIAGSAVWTIAGGDERLHVAEKLGDAGGASGLIASNTVPLTIHIRAALAQAGGNDTVLFIENSPAVQLLYTTAPQIRFYGTSYTNVYSPGVMQDFVIILDPANGRRALYVDGVEIHNVSGSVWTWSGSYQMRLLGNDSAGSADGVVGDIESVTIWTEAATDGDTSGLTQVYKSLSGGRDQMVTDGAGDPRIVVVENGAVVSA